MNKQDKWMQELVRELAFKMPEGKGIEISLENAEMAYKNNYSPQVYAKLLLRDSKIIPI